MVGNDHQGKETVIIIVAYSKIICAIRVERRDKGTCSTLFHIIFDMYNPSGTCIHDDFAQVDNNAGPAALFLRNGL